MVGVLRFIEHFIPLFNYFFANNRHRLSRYCIDVLKANYFNNTFIRYSVGVWEVLFSPFEVDSQDEDSPQLFGISCRGKGGKKYAHRICDDPDKNEVLIELSDEELKGLHLSAICR